VVFSRPGKRLIVCGKERAELLELSTGKALGSVKAEKTQFLAAFGPDGQPVVVSVGGGELKPSSWSWVGATVSAWDLEAGRQRPSPSYRIDVHSYSLAPEGRFLGATSSDGSVDLWDLATGQRRPLQGKHDGYIVSLAFSPDGRLLATGGYWKDKQVKIREVNSGKELSAPPGHSGVVAALAFSPDGTLLASAGSNESRQGNPGELKVWDVDRGTQAASLWDLPAFPHSRSALAFSPDGKTLAAGADSTLLLWDRDSRRLRATLSGVVEPGGSLAFSPDGKLLATTHQKAVKLWDVETLK
jgi:WD40 repeat protein